MFNAYEKFEKLRRIDLSMLNEFERLHQDLESYEIVLPTQVLAYQVLKNTGLPKTTCDLALATLSGLTFDNMKKQLKAISDQCTRVVATEEESDILVKEESTYYTVGRQNYNPQRGS